jgi:hypothetical protein
LSCSFLNLPGAESSLSLRIFFPLREKKKASYPFVHINRAIGDPERGKV